VAIATSDVPIYVVDDDASVREAVGLIEKALADTGGLVSGRSGAATRLGMPPSTLQSRIRTLKIDKSRFASGC
jgi:formate hydrogenlyase transcriptional activator